MRKTVAQPPAPEPETWTPPPGFRAGIVSLVGQTNVGKSTLLNRILGRKVAIVSPKPQTTRTRITGVLTRPEGQIVFWDTPGIHEPHFELNKRMVQIAYACLRNVDLIGWVIDVEREAYRPYEPILNLLREVQAETPVFLIINKIDRVPKAEVLPVIDRYRQWMDFREIVPVSALRGTNVEELVRTILKYLPEGPPLFPPGQWTDADERFLIAELIREKVFHSTRQEVPYCTAVHIPKVEVKGSVWVVYADIWVERDSQKGIIIGKGGQMLKRIGARARQEIEALLGQRVYLDLQVRVREKWRQRPSDLDLLGIRWE